MDISWDLVPNLNAGLDPAWLSEIHRPIARPLSDSFTGCSCNSSYWNCISKDAVIRAFCRRRYPSSISLRKTQGGTRIEGPRRDEMQAHAAWMQLSECCIIAALRVHIRSTLRTSRRVTRRRSVREEQARPNAAPPCRVPTHSVALRLFRSRKGGRIQPRFRDSRPPNIALSRCLLRSVSPSCAPPPHHDTRRCFLLTRSGASALPYLHVPPPLLRPACEGLQPGSSSGRRYGSGRRVYGVDARSERRVETEMGSNTDGGDGVCNALRLGGVRDIGTDGGVAWRSSREGLWGAELAYKDDGPVPTCSQCRGASAGEQRGAQERLRSRVITSSSSSPGSRLLTIWDMCAARCAENARRGVGGKRSRVNTCFSLTDGSGVLPLIVTCSRLSVSTLRRDHPGVPVSLAPIAAEEVSL
ncbi:hypothetical protein K438DRAFT_1766221 [Mycena galopus ATCC 62051]|nr:hypothetical protein K438DRAFT_1766221 [Mycena galopus ATCC 62051]